MANNKVLRMLDAMAVLCKDEDPKFIKAMDDLINDRHSAYAEKYYLQDGYEFDFVAKCESFKRIVKGRSY